MTEKKKKAAGDFVSPRDSRSDGRNSGPDVSVLGGDVDVVVVVVVPQRVGVLFADAGMEKLLDVGHQLRRVRIWDPVTRKRSFYERKSMKSWISR